MKSDRKSDKAAADEPAVDPQHIAPPTEAPADPAGVLAEGRCIEVSGDGFTIKVGPLEHHFVLPGHMVELGQTVRVLEDMTLELVGVAPPAPPDTVIPSQPQPMK